MRILYFDGLKGISAIIVMLSHFLLAFPKFEFLRNIPVLSLLFDGGMAVYIFVALSGYGICSAIDKDRIESVISRFVIKRYFRLTLPLIIPSLLAFVCSNEYVSYCYEAGTENGSVWLQNLIPLHPTLRMLLSGIAVGVIKGSALINPLWMMGYIFLGTFLVIPLFVAMKKLSKDLYRFLFILFFAIVFSSVSLYYSSIVLGIALYIFRKNLEHSNKLVVLFVFFVIALNAFYYCEYAQVVNGLMIIPLVCSCSLMRALFSSNIMIRIYRISYQLYLVHATILATICSYLYIVMDCSDSTKYMTIFVSYLISCITLSYVLSKIDLFVSLIFEKLYLRIILQ